MAADLGQPRTLLPEHFVGVRALVVCSAAKVQPKEGDTVDRAKYLQVGRREGGGGEQGRVGRGGQGQVLLEGEQEGGGEHQGGGDTVRR